MKAECLLNMHKSIIRGTYAFSGMQESVNYPYKGEHASRRSL